SACFFHLFRFSMPKTQKLMGTAIARNEIHQTPPTREQAMMIVVHMLFLGYLGQGPSGAGTALRRRASVLVRRSSTRWAMPSRTRDSTSSGPCPSVNAGRYDSHPSRSEEHTS